MLVQVEYQLTINTVSMFCKKVGRYGLSPKNRFILEKEIIFAFKQSPTYHSKSYGKAS